MIGKSQLMPFYSKTNGFTISSIEDIYNISNQEEVSFLNEKMKLIPCDILYYGEKQIKAFHTSDQTIHYLDNEKIIINGNSDYSDNIKLMDSVIKYIKPYMYFNKKQVVKVTSDNYNNYHIGMFIGLIYLYGAMSTHKITFMISQKMAENTNGKIETFERLFNIMLDILDIKSYKRTFVEKKDNSYYMYEIFLNLKTTKIINNVYDKYINSYTKKLVYRNFLENHLFLQGFLDIAFKKVNINKFTTTYKNIAVEIFNLANLFGYNVKISKDDKFRYNVDLNLETNMNLIFGILHNNIIKIESLMQKTYEIIPKINSNDNIFITGSKTFLDKRNLFKNNS